ncbi:MAG: ZIP family metal transporter [Patescibacteria group bacterium]
MDTISLIFLAAFSIMLLSLVGVISIQATIGRRIYANLPYLVSFAAGVLLLSAVYLIVESIDLLGSLLIAMALVLIGYTLVQAIKQVWPQFHHHHDSECEVTHSSGKRILIADGIHNVADGLVLVPAFLASPWVGFGVFISIATHELLQELSEFFILRQAGYSTTKALLYNFAVSSTILIGVVLGLFFTQTTYLQGLLLALSAGFFINIVLHDLLPHHHHLSKKSIITHLAMISIGMVLIAGINQLFEHSHFNEGEDNHEHNSQHSDI